MDYETTINQLQEMVRRARSQKNPTIRVRDLDAIRSTLERFDEDMPDEEHRQIGF